MRPHITARCNGLKPPPPLWQRPQLMKGRARKHGLALLEHASVMSPVIVSRSLGTVM